MVVKVGEHIILNTYINNNMTLENQVVSLDLAKRMKELGFKQESLFYWYLDGATPYITNATELEIEYGHAISAYTVAELGEMLPKGFDVGKTFFNEEENRFVCGREEYPKWFYGNTAAESMSKMLIYLKENNLI